MNISGISDETRRQLFGKGKQAKKMKPSLAPVATTFQSLNGKDIEIPDISASTPVRCSVGEKDRPAGWQNLLERRLQKGPLSPITSSAVNKDRKTVTASGALGTTSSALLLAEKANAAYRQKKSSSKTTIQEELKRQSTLAAGATIGASLDWHISQTKSKSSKKAPPSPSKPVPSSKSKSAQRPTLPSKVAPPSQRNTTKSNTNQLSSLPRAAEPQKVTTPKQDLSPSTMRLIEKYATPSKEKEGTQQIPNPSFEPIQQEEKKQSRTNVSKPTEQESKRNNFLQAQDAAQHQQSSDLFHERSPMCRLRSNSPARSVMRYQDIDSISSKDNQGIEVVYQISSDESKKRDKLVMSSSISTLNPSLENKVQSTVSTTGMRSVKNVLGFAKDFEKTGQILLTDTKASLVAASNSVTKPSPNYMEKKTCSLTSNKVGTVAVKQSVFKSATLAKKAACQSPPKQQRRTDTINHHKRLTTLKSIGIDFEKTYLIRKSAKKAPANVSICKSSSSPPIRTNSVSCRTSKREELYETVRRRRCLILQARRGVVAPTSKKPAYQRYCFLERQRLKQLGKYTEVPQLKKNPSTESSATVATMRSCCSNNNHEMMAQAVKRRKARMTLAASRQNLNLQLTSSTDSVGSRSCEKRAKALGKINRNKAMV